MATRNPISTISYNTEPFLKEVLERLYQAHIIQAYQYIKHKGEEGDKDHIHLRIEPNKTIDAMSISDMLEEYDPKHPDKPLGIRPWRPSKEEDWFLYVTHDPDYMALKYADSETEKLPYEYTDIIVSKNYDLEAAWIRAKQALKHLAPSVVKSLAQGERPVDLVLRGEGLNTVLMANRLLTLEGETVPITEYRQLKEQYKQALGIIDQLREDLRNRDREIEDLRNKNDILTVTETDLPF